MRVVVDTNVLLTSISSLSKTHKIFQKLINGEIEIAVTTDILLEYEEIFLRRTNPILLMKFYMSLKFLKINYKKVH